jgi:hypothetical protein
MIKIKPGDTHNISPTENRLKNDKMQQKWINLISNYLRIVDLFLHHFKSEHISAMFAQQGCHDHHDNLIGLAIETQSLYVAEIILAEDSNFPELVLDVAEDERQLGVAELVRKLKAVGFPGQNL